MKGKYLPVSLVIVLLGACFSLSAQTNTQLWMDWQVSYPFRNRYLLENTTSYQTLLTKGERWASFSLSPNLEYTLLPWLDLTAELPVAYTRQTDQSSSFEFSPMVGAKYSITQNKRVTIRLLTKFQHRNFYHIESNTWELKGRFRVKGEVWVSINHPTLFYDKLWYTFVDYEEFIVIDEQVNERYANLRRARLGLGYRHSYAHRFEIVYSWQYSRDEISDVFTYSDKIIQLRYKLYLNAPKVASGN
ncbi:MAG: DUF2490 domain-containing protein [Cyclobacteriaceae bacterium]|nr:DUF2490 domain-containing protein [Cyclobacteriaceae bacterium]